MKLAQNQALLEQEIIQARIQKIQATSNKAQAEADYATAAADPSTRPEELQAKQLNIVAADIQGQAADFALATAFQALQQFWADADLQRSLLRDQQEADLFQERANLAKITESEKDDRAIRDEALSRARSRDSDAFGQEIDASINNLQNLNAQMQEFSAGIMNAQPGAPGVQAPQVAIPNYAPSQAQLANLPQAGGPDMVPGMDGMMGSKTFNIEVNNTFTGTGQPDQ